MCEKQSTNKSAFETGVRTKVSCTSKIERLCDLSADIKTIRVVSSEEFSCVGVRHPHSMLGANLQKDINIELLRFSNFIFISFTLDLKLHFISVFRFPLWLLSFICYKLVTVSSCTLTFFRKSDFLECYVFWSVTSLKHIHPYLISYKKYPYTDLKLKRDENALMPYKFCIINTCRALSFKLRRKYKYI